MEPKEPKRVPCCYLTIQMDSACGQHDIHNFRFNNAAWDFYHPKGANGKRAEFSLEEEEEEEQKRKKLANLLDLNVPTMSQTTVTKLNRENTNIDLHRLFKLFQWPFLKAVISHFVPLLLLQHATVMLCQVFHVFLFCRVGSFSWAGSSPLDGLVRGRKLLSLPVQTFCTTVWEGIPNCSTRSAPFTMVDEDLEAAPSM